MTQKRPEIPKVLNYLKGEQIIKQGDYGISIYKILSGKVEVFKRLEGVDVPLATLEAGGIIGERAFLSKDGEVRSASAAALEDTELQVWHPKDLEEKYAQISSALKIIIAQALTRLLRTNRFLEQLALKRREEMSQPKGKADPWSSKRVFYRKEVDIPCKYKPSRGTKGPLYPLRGRIKDISMGGLCLEVAPDKESVTRYEVGNSFHIDAILPDGQNLNATAEIVSVKEQAEKVRLGMKFKKLPDYYGAKKNVGFFLLPT
jgi:hypothetical protein